MTESKNPRDRDTRSAAAIHADAYKLFDAVKALKAIQQSLVSEQGGIERIEREIQRHANLLGIPLTSLKTRYEQYGKDREDQRVEAWIEGGVYDEAVTKRTRRMMLDASQPVPDGTKVPRPFATVTVTNGRIEQIVFDIQHGLPNGTYAMVKA